MSAGRRIARTVIRGYQLLLAPLFVGACRFEPTCSSYALQAVDRFGPLRGGWLGLRRIARCHPWGGLGFDPVPGTDKSSRPRDAGTMGARADAR